MRWPKVFGWGHVATFRVCSAAENVSCREPQARFMVTAPAIIRTREGWGKSWRARSGLLDRRDDAADRSFQRGHGLLAKRLPAMQVDAVLEKGSVGVE